MTPAKLRGITSLASTSVLDYDLTAKGINP